jgi:hypothetical protein
MTASAKQLLNQALQLPGAEREKLAEKLVESLVTPLDPEIERAHLHAVQERRTGYQAGRTKLIDAHEATKQIRATLRR